GYNNRPGQGGYNNRPGQGGGRPGAGGGFDAPAKMTAKEQEKHRDEQEKRRQNQDKKRKDNYSDADGFRGGKAVKGVKQLERPQEKQAVKEEEKIKVITLPESLTIKELAEKMKMQPSVIVKKLFLKGTIVTVNQEVTYEVAEEIAMEFEVLCEKEVVVDVIEELLKEDEEDTSLMTSRPPVICVMGHVDHGKTSLLDAIRKTNVTDREAGGITQHIGAYVVTINGQKITFLDTPGHEAFTAMRMRGANATDIAILVVAADDGVMPQTIEAINHAKAAGIEIIVAVNKIDKPSANIDKVKQELAEYELIPEDWGGSTVFAPVSAKSGEGIEQLLEMILLTADILELKANAKRKARGLVIEAELDKGRGPVATVLVQKGTLKVGDFIAAGSCHGKVRAMIDDKGKRVKEAGPSTPVEILGLGDVPAAGDIFVAPENDKEARSFAATFISQGRVKMLDDTKAKMLSLDDLFTQIQAGNLKELSIIIKADVQGSVEAVKESLLKLTNDEVVVKVIHGGVGAINESDVILASASNAIIIGFNVRPDATAKATAETEGVDVRLYNVIYKAIEDVEAAMKGMLDPVFEEKVLGHGEVRQIFKASGIGNIAGSYVLDGIFQRGCSVRITREGEQIFEGPLASLKRFKDDVKEVKAGFECGLVFDGFNDIQELDQVEAYTMVEVPR
ncbi:MAG: translation initiation factor IF-2, partial [bacterium]|nr:translation initiation factor IF-2 [bacterium]